MLFEGEGVPLAAVTPPAEAIVEEGVVRAEDVFAADEELDDVNEDEVGVVGDHLAFFASGPPAISIGPR